MLSRLFLGLSLVGAEWVLYFLLLLSVVSIALILERLFYFWKAAASLGEFRSKLREKLASGKPQDVSQEIKRFVQAKGARFTDLESATALALLEAKLAGESAESLQEAATDAMLRARLKWEGPLFILATIGSNAPFIGLFGTVLGIIRAFHDLSQQQGAGAQMVTGGISEALVATAVGLLVAIPAAVAFNFFQRRVKEAWVQAEALKSFMLGKLLEK